MTPSSPLPVARPAFSLCLLAALCAATTSGSLLFSANGTWDGGGANANWTTLGNWAGDAAFPGGINDDANADTALFNSAIANTWGAPGTPILIDSAGLSIKNITFDTASVGSFILGTTGGNALRLISGGVIRIADNVGANITQTISAPLVIIGENGTYSFDNARDVSTTKLILNGGISAGSAGNATINFTSRQGSSPNEVNGVVSDGAATHLTLNHNTGTWTYTGNNTYTGDTLVNGGTANLAGAYSGGGALRLQSAAGSGATPTVNLTGNANFSGDVLLSGLGNTATLSLGTGAAAGGALTAATSITLRAAAIGGARLTLNNTAGNGNRILDTATVSMDHAQLTLTGNATVNTTETIGALIVDNGMSTVSLGSAANRATTLAAASLTRTNRATLFVTGTNLGATNGNNSTLFTFAASPAAQLVGSGGAASAASSGVKNLGILPWVIAGGSGNATDFATYDTANGLRHLAANETQISITAASSPSGGQTGDNVKISAASETGITTKIINSLMLAPGATQTVTGAGAGHTLTISSGGLGLATAFTSTVSGFDSITFGNGEAVILLGYVNSNLILNSSIAVTNSGGLTKAGSGTLVLGAANTYSGTTLIQAGTLQLGTGGTTGDIGTGNLVLQAGTTLNYNRTNALSIGSVSGGGSIQLTQTNGRLTLNQTGTGNVINTVSGASGSTLVFAGDGVTTINTQLATAGQLIQVSSGTLNLGATRNIAANLLIDGGIVNATDGQTGFNTTAGPQTFTLSGGQFNTFGTFGLSGFNTGSSASGTGVANIFTGTQTGGTLTIYNLASQARFALGSATAGATTTYTLSGGVFDASRIPVFQIGAEANGGSTATLNLSGGKLLSAGTISGAQGNGAKQAFVWTGGTLATFGYEATKLTSTAGTAVSASTNTLTNAGGILAPGDIGVTGRTAITGNYAVTSADAALHIDLAGTTASGAFQDAAATNRYDNVVMTGSGKAVALDGKLHVNLLDSFNGTGSFTIISGASAITGSFTNTFANAQAAGQRVVLDNGLSSYLVTYNPTNVTLSAFLAGNAWAGTGGGAWSTGSNWSAFTPQAAGHIAQFTSAATADSTINLDTDRTLGGLVFDNAAHGYTIATDSDRTLTLDNTKFSGPADSTITVAAGAHTLAVPVVLANNLAIATTGASSSLTLAGPLGGTGKSVTKTGDGTLTFTAANTYTGGTIISAGTLLVNNTTGSGTGSGSLLVAFGATLGGSGTIGGAATVNGSLNPGNSPGVLTFADGLTLGSSSTTTMEIAGSARGTQHDGIDVTGGSLTYGGTLVINFSTTLSADATYDLFNPGVGSPSGSFALVSITGAHITDLSNDSGLWTGSADGYAFTFNQSTGDLSVLAAVPEPSTYTILLALGTGLFGVLRRRARLIR